MDQFVTPDLAARLRRLGHRTHSLVTGEEPETINPATISGDQWWPERIIKVTRWPSGDVGVSVVDRKARKARCVAAKRQTGELSEDDSQRATRRARRRIWRGCQELEADCILTIAINLQLTITGNQCLHPQDNQTTPLTLLAPKKCPPVLSNHLWFMKK